MLIWFKAFINWDKLSSVQHFSCKLSSSSKGWIAIAFSLIQVALWCKLDATELCK